MATKLLVPFATAALAVLTAIQPPDLRAQAAAPSSPQVASSPPAASVRPVIDDYRAS